MDKKFLVGAVKTLPSLSTAYESHIVETKQIPNHQYLHIYRSNNDCEKISFSGSSFLFTFIIIKSILQLSFGFSDIWSLITHLKTIMTIIYANQTQHVSFVQGL